MELKDIFREKVGLNRENDEKIIKNCEEMIKTKLMQAKEELFIDGDNVITVVNTTKAIKGIEVYLNGCKIGELKNSMLPSKGFKGLASLFKEEAHLRNVNQNSRFEDQKDDEYMSFEAIEFKFDFNFD